MQKPKQMEPKARTVQLPEPTAEQVDYLSKMNSKGTSFDPTTLVGGPSAYKRRSGLN
jgi:hypothetical protein